MPQPGTDDHAYLSIIEWPEGLDESARVEGLVRGAGLDRHAALMAVRRGTPQVIARMDRLAASRAAENLHALGAIAFAPSRAEMAAAAGPLAIKRLLPAAGAPEPMYACEAWRGDGPILRMADAFLVVRATLATAESRPGPSRPKGMSALSFGTGLGGVAIAGALADPGSGRSTHLSTSETLDLWLRDGSRVRVEGRRFAFDLPDERRGLSEHENIDLLIARFRREASRVIVDCGFPDFRCPPDVVRSQSVETQAGAVQKTTDGPVFEFYSVWAFLMYRLLLPGP
jgi:hypothetical protein